MKDLSNGKSEIPHRGLCETSGGTEARRYAVYSVVSSLRGDTLLLMGDF